MRGSRRWASGLELFLEPTQQAPREILERKRGGGRQIPGQEELRGTRGAPYNGEGITQRGGLSKAMARFWGDACPFQGEAVLDVIWAVPLPHMRSRNRGRAEEFVGVTSSRL